MNMTRRYTMRARARSVEDTRRRILDAVGALADDRVLAAISLDDIAAEAGVSVQTVLRQFGTRAALLEATAAHIRAAVAEERETPVGDIDAGIRVLVDHYEQRGDPVLLLLAQESGDAFVRTITDAGRRLHRDWVGRLFAPLVGQDERAIDLLVVATDVYAWKLLRRDRGLSRSETEERMGLLVRGVLAALRAEAP